MHKVNVRQPGATPLYTAAARAILLANALRKRAWDLILRPFLIMKMSKAVDFYCRFIFFFAIGISYSYLWGQIDDVPDLEDTWIKYH